MFGCAIAALGQVPANSNEYSAPIAWTEYNIPSQRLSVLFPKLPVARVASDPCSRIERALYHAYAAGVVYEFEWHAKSDDPRPDWCTTKTKFSKTAFTNRLTELKKQQWGYVESETRVAGKSAQVLRSSSSVASVHKTRWLIWQNDRWLELGITRRDGTAVDEGRFLEGMKLSSSAGADIGSGAEGTLGDADEDLNRNFDGKERVGLTIVTMPKASYTEAARQANLQGTVILRVAFLRNGGIGSVSVVKGLPLGLTEQAIVAARKLAFLPGTVDGKPINITKQVEYTFSIY